MVTTATLDVDTNTVRMYSLGAPGLYTNRRPYTGHLRTKAEQHVMCYIFSFTVGSAPLITQHHNFLYILFRDAIY